MVPPEIGPASLQICKHQSQNGPGRRCDGPPERATLPPHGPSMTAAEVNPPPVDNPISSSIQDRLGRAPVAASFARRVRALDASEGLVIAVLGPWGYGKSSFLNLMREQFGEEPAVAVVEFNPWLFSGTQQLVDFFFAELASSLRLQGEDRFGKAAGALREYGDLLAPLGAIPFFGSWWDRTFTAGKSFAEWMSKRRAQSVGSMRERVAAALREVPSPIVVVVDDIDRLTSPEIRDVFRLVRLTARFPNLIYLLAFDRERVEAALAEDHLPGRAYLEKIVQLGFDLPAVPARLLRSQIFMELDRVLGDVEDLRFDEDRWADAFVEIMEPLIRSPRDVSRFVLSAGPVIAALGAEIEAVDLLAIETIRVLRPELFMRIQSLRAGLTAPATAGYGATDLDPRTVAVVAELLEAAGPDTEVVRSLVARVFPAGEHLIGGSSYRSDWLGEWGRAHRLAHADFADLYFDRVAPDGLDAFRAAEYAHSILADESALASFFESLNPSTLRDVVGALESYEGHYPPDGVVPGAVVLMNLVADIPDSPGGFVDFGRAMTVSRVVFRLLRSIDDDGLREAAVREAVARVESLSSKYELIQLVGHIEHAGLKLVSATVASELEDTFIREVAAAPPAAPAREWALLHAYWFATSRGASLDPEWWGDAEVVRALLKSAKSERKAQYSGSRAVRRQTVLAWDTLIDVLKSEATISRAVQAVEAVEGASELVQLAQKYLTGWRPPERF